MRIIKEGWRLVTLKVSTENLRKLQCPKQRTKQKLKIKRLQGNTIHTYV